MAPEDRIWTADLDDTSPQITTAGDLETTLLLANIEAALRSLKKAGHSDDQDGVLQRLEAALHTYGSVKHLLPKLNLNAGQRATVEKQLQELRTQIVGST